MICKIIMTSFVNIFLLKILVCLCHGSLREKEGNLCYFSMMIHP